MFDSDNRIISPINAWKLATVEGDVSWSGDPNGIGTGIAPIFHAARNVYDNDEAIKELIYQRVDKDVRDNDGQTALHIAAEFKRLKILRTLVIYGADIHSGGTNNSTPLFFAARPYEKMNDILYEKQISIIKYLLEKNADVNATNFQGDTPLMYAAKGSRFQIIKQLLKAGANLQAKNNKNQTCLHIHLEKPGNLIMIRELITAGLDIFAKDINGKDSIQYIANSEDRSLDQKVSEMRTLIKTAIFVNFPKELDFHLESIDSDVRYRIGRFADESYEEMREMKCTTLKFHRTYTLHDFALKGDEANDRTKALAWDKLIEQNFQIYNDYFAVHFKRTDMIEMLQKNGIYAKTDLGDVRLAEEAHPAFFDLLSHTDLYNLLHAYNLNPPISHV